MIPQDLILRAREREQRSREHEQRFKDGDENALREFCRMDPFATQTPWVTRAIQNALLCGNSDLLKKVFTGITRSQSRVTTMTENLLILDGITRLAKETGLPIVDPNIYDESVFNRAYHDQIFTFGKVQGWQPKTLLKRYDDAKKQIPDVMIVSDKGGQLLRVGPALCMIEEKNVVGIHEQYFPDDGSDIEVRFNGVANVPLTQNRKEVVPFI